MASSEGYVSYDAGKVNIDQNMYLLKSLHFIIKQVGGLGECDM